MKTHYVRNLRLIRGPERIETSDPASWSAARKISGSFVGRSELKRTAAHPRGRLGGISGSFVGRSELRLPAGSRRPGAGFISGSFVGRSELKRREGGPRVRLDGISGSFVGRSELKPRGSRGSGARTSDLRLIRGPERIETVAVDLCLRPTESPAHSWAGAN